MSRNRNRNRKRRAVSSQDSYENMFMGMSKAADHTAGLTPGRGLYLNDVQLSNIYTSDGIGSRILKLLPHDMVKNGYKVVGDNEDKIQKELKRINNKKVTLEALNWMRTYGGSVTVVGVNDGKKLDKPMGTRYTKVQWMKSVARTRIEVYQSDLITNPNSEDFGEYEYYHVNFGDIGGTPVKVHRSRCLIYKGMTTPDDPNWYSDQKTKYWGMSAIQPIWNQLKQMGGSFQGMAHLMMELVIGKYKLKDLATLLSSPNAELVVKRLELIQQSKGIINGVVLDAESEDYVRDGVNVSGTDKIMEQFMIMVSAASGYPVTVLFGRSPDGMNATGESDLSNYDSLIESSQETILEGPQQKLVKIINNYTKVTGVEEDPILMFNPVRRPPMSEMVKAMETVAKIDEIYLRIGTHSADDIREMRFLGGYDPLRMDITEFQNWEEGQTIESRGVDMDPEDVPSAEPEEEDV